MNDEMRKIFHDLNNTLGAVMLNIEVALDAGTDAESSRESVRAALAASLELRDTLVALRRHAVAGGVK